MPEFPIPSCQLEIVLALQLTFNPASHNLNRMRGEILVLAAAVVLPALGELKSGPQLPHHVVMDWAQLPKGWNFGECSGVSIDKDDNRSEERRVRKDWR